MTTIVVLKDPALLLHCGKTAGPCLTVFARRPCLADLVFCIEERKLVVQLQREGSLK